MNPAQNGKDISAGMTRMMRIEILMGFSGALEYARRESFCPRNQRNPRQILYGSGSCWLDII